jgi:hypothetical protein
MQISYEHCGETQTSDLTRLSSGPLRCEHCDELIMAVDVSATAEWIESQVDRKRHLLETGQLGTRKQSTQQTDSDIDRDGLSAELAACAILCPNAFVSWTRAAERSKGNRGRDLLRTWTGLNRPVEVKHTRYQDDHRGFLVIRPPRNTPGRMRAEYIDDAYYVLMTGEPFRHKLVGWIDRAGLLAEGQLNPVPVGHSQRESWGIHWSKLRPIDELARKIGQGGLVGSFGRWFEDHFGG